MDNTTCKTCEYFQQHYIFSDKRFRQAYCGHCKFYRRTKTRKPDAPACENYNPGCEEREVFASKEYLTKELLHYILNLEIFQEAK